MNKLIIPPSPNWYEVDILACAPDNTLIYGSYHDIIIIKPTANDKPSDIDIISKAHPMKIVSVNVNKNWGSPHKYAVTVGEDTIVKLWNIEKLEKLSSHNKHFMYKGNLKVVGACFAGDDRIVSVSENGDIILWNISINETSGLKFLLANKLTITYFSICPHATWLAAFGLKTGLIIIADLRKNGQVLFKLRGHEKPVVSLSWCPVPVNIFPSRPQNKVVEMIFETEASVDNNLTEKCDRRKQKNPKKREEEENPAENDCLSDYIKLNENILQSSSQDDQDTASLETPRMANRKIGKGTLADILIDKTVTDHSEKDIADIETPTDRSVIPMEISYSVDRQSIQQESNLVKSDSNLFQTSPHEERASGYLSPTVCNQSTEFSSASSCKLNFSTEQKMDLGMQGSSAEFDTSYVFQDAPSDDLKLTKDCVGSDDWRVAEQPRREFLLASSGKEPNIYIWRAGTDGRMQTFLTIPHGLLKRNVGRPDRLWVTLCWASPHTLLSSSRFAELISWTLPKPLDNFKFFHIVGKCHRPVVFSIKAPIVYSNEYNFLQQTKSICAWSTGMERLLINTDMRTGDILSSYQAFGGNVNCLVGSPVDPNRLAIGTGPGVVHIWDVSKDNKKQIYFNSFSQKILSAITALAWHPDDEKTLAFGTVEGRVGILLYSGKTKATKVLRQFFKSQIFKIEWGPVSGNNERSLYVASEGKIGIFNPNEINRDPVLLELPDCTVVYTMSWKPDFSKCLVSTKEGTLVTYNPDRTISNISYVQNRLQKLIWHPYAVTSDRTISKYCHTFVAVVQSNSFLGYDLNKASDNIEEKIIFHFKNKSVINSVAWSPHFGNHLVMVDDRGLAQVYDIESKTVLSTYINPALDSLLSVCWSPLDGDFIITGSIKDKVIVWQVSENPPLTEKEITSWKNKISRHQQKDSFDQSIEIETEPVKDNQTSSKKASKASILPLFYPSKEMKPIDDIRKLLQYKINQKSDVLNVESSKNIDVLDVFGVQSDFENLLDLNIEMLKRQGKHKNSDMLSLFKGDINQTIKDAIDQKRVTPWIISLCPMVSPNLWQVACETYVQQLQQEQDSDPLEIVTYLLACHKVDESIKVLCDEEMFREAYTLAKVRFGNGSLMVKQVLDKWASRMTHYGNFEQAAQCYITMGKFQEAASVLFRRSDITLLEVAAELAHMSGNEELYKAVKFRFDAFKAETDKNAGKLLETTPEMLDQLANILTSQNIETIEEPLTSGIDLNHPGYKCGEEKTVWVERMESESAITNQLSEAATGDATEKMKELKEGTLPKGEEEFVGTIEKKLSEASNVNVASSSEAPTKKDAVEEKDTLSKSVEESESIKVYQLVQAAKRDMNEGTNVANESKEGILGSNDEDSK